MRMITELTWHNIKDDLPEVNQVCLCHTSNDKYFISETYHPHDGRGNITDYKRKCWKGSSKATDSITHWAYLEEIENE